MRTKADQETLMMEDGINKFIGRMMHMHQINIGGGTSVQIGKIKPIDMRVTMRSNGKKVRRQQAWKKNMAIKSFVVLIAFQIAGDVGEQSGDVRNQSERVQQRLPVSRRKRDGHQRFRQEKYSQCSRSGQSNFIREQATHR